MGSNTRSTLIRIKKAYLFLASQLFAVGYIYRVSFAPITDVVEEELNTTSTGLGLVSSVVYFGYSSMQIPYGLSLQKLNPEFILFICCLGLGITSLLFTLSRNVIIATIINTISGMFIAPSFIIHINITIQVFGNKYVALMVGFTLLQSYIATLSSTTLQAYFYQKYNDWKIMFYFVTIYCFLAAIILFILMLYQSYIHTNILHNDYINDNVELIDKTDKTDKTPLILSKNEKKNTFCGSIIFVNQRNDTNIDKNKITLLIALKAAACNYWNYMIGFYGFGLITTALSFNGLWLIAYMMIKFDYSRETAAAISSSFFVATGIGSVIYGKLAIKLKQRKPLMMSGAILMIPSLYIIYCDRNTSMYLIIIMNLISGIGCGAQSVLFVLIKEYNEYYNCTQCGTGYVNTMVTCTGFVTQFLMGDLLDLHWNSRGGNDFHQNGDRNYSESDYDFAFIVIPISIGLAFILAFFTKETNSKLVDYSKPSF